MLLRINQFALFQKSSWVEKFCVLHKKTEDNHPFLEFFESRQAFIKCKEQKGKTEVKKIDLQQVRSIRHSAHKGSKQTEYHIEIKCRSHKIYLMFTHDNEAQDWYSKLGNTVDIAERGEDGSSTGIIDLVSQDIDSDDENDEVITLNNLYGISHEGLLSIYSTNIDIIYSRA